MLLYTDAFRGGNRMRAHPMGQGDVRDSDNHGGQQYVPLMEIEIPGL